MTRRLAIVSTLAALLVVWSLLGSQDATTAEGTNMQAEEIRESILAGSWYPGDPKRLRQDVETYLGKASAADLQGQLVALIAPHAGYSYSGQVAASAYKLLEHQKFETVVIIAPSHRAYFSGVSVYDRGGFRTPLGVVPLDGELVRALEERDHRIRYVAEAQAQEHSLEIQLPFLQVVMPGFKLVPLIMGDQSFASCQWLAEAVADTIGKKSVLVVASTDLSHFHPYQDAKKLDQVVLDEVNAFDPRGLSENLQSGKCEACGGGPVVTAMLIARKLGANKSQVLRYANSGDVTGDRSGVVGYMAAAMWGNPKEKEDAQGGGRQRKVGVDLGLTPQEKKALLELARKTIEAKCRRERAPEPEAQSPTFNEPRGAFVTIHKQGRLRGCIGQIHARQALVKTVAEMAIAAAFDDPRFPPLRREELKDIDIEISVLTPLRRITDVGEIQVGTHGIYLRRGGYSGLLLPQVATEWGWDRNTFLEHTCEKAHLPKDAWKDKDTEIYIFSAEVF
jgi:AmmeMemoRadiSam system protein B/AmmeMemoRadiSam system protein A